MKKLLIIVGAVVAVCGAFVGAFFFFRKKYAEAFDFELDEV